MTKRWDDFSSKMRRTWSLPWWTLILLLTVTALVGVGGYMQPWLLRQGELLLYDVNAHSIRRSPSPRIALVVVGERSLAELGAWPFPRSRHAALLRQLRQARVVGMDMLFPEPALRASDDLALAQAMVEHGRVVLAAHTIPLSEAADAAQSAILPVAALFEAAADVGYTNVDKDIDGLIRFAHPIRSAGSEMLPSLAFSLARQALQEEGEIQGGRYGFSLRFGGHSVQMDSDARLWFVPSAQEPPTFEYVDVLQGRIPAEVFKNAIVLVGASASGVADYQVVPEAFGSRVITGVRFNAEELHALLTGDGVDVLPPWVNALAAMSLALISGLLMALSRPLRGWLLILSVSLLWLGSTWFLLVRHLVWIGGFTPVVGAACTGALMLFARLIFLHESWRAQHISLDSIVLLESNEIRAHTTLGAYMQALWPRVEAETGIHFLDGPLTQEELPAEFSSSATALDGVLIIQGKGASRRMAVPLRSDAGTTYVLFGWNRRISADSARATVALAVSAAWYFHVQSEGQRQRKMLRETIKAVFTALDYRDTITGGHSTRVSELCLLIMDRMDLPQQLYEDIHLGSMIHDIGKIGIPDHILNKKDFLTSEEFQIIRNHPNIAQGILASVHLPKAAFEAVYQHHERYDGSGYPQGLRGEAISLAGRIVAIADVFDAMSHARPYRQGQPLDEVLKFMLEQKGRHFDPEIFQIFLEIFRSHPAGPDSKEDAL